MSDYERRNEDADRKEIAIVLDLPMPPSANRLWRYARGGRVHRSREYVTWCEQADRTVMATKKPGRLPKIMGPFKVVLYLNREHGGDGDNRIKAALDYLQSRDIIRNDRDCIAGEWMWADSGWCPRGFRIMVMPA